MATGDAPRTVLRRTVSTTRRPTAGLRRDPNGGAESRGELRLMMIACEDGTPYGPESNTAAMFLDLICGALSRGAGGGGAPGSLSVEVSIAIYRAKLRDYPRTQEEWDGYDGVLLPGSLSSAHAGGVEWIEALKGVVRRELHGRGRRTWCVCFGHQAYAHSLGEAGGEEEKGATGGGGGGGAASVCPAGFQAGRRALRLTPEGAALLRPPPEDRLDPPGGGGGGGGDPGGDGGAVQLLYTHGDMVRSLPPCAVPLGGNDDVPIQAAAYFASEAEARAFRDAVAASTRGPDRASAPRPRAVTLQAHPEYRSERGMRTFGNILTVLAAKEVLPSAELEAAGVDAERSLDTVGEHSDDVTAAAMGWLGWF